MRSVDINEVEKAAQLYSDNIILFRNKHAEQLYLSPFGLNLESFRLEQQKMSPKLVSDIVDRIGSLKMGVDTIITGIDPNSDPRIFLVGGVNEFNEEDFYPICCDRRGFLAVGIGDRQFESLFMSSGYGTTWGMLETMFLMYSAKRHAQSSPGIGDLTDMFIIEPPIEGHGEGGFHLLSEDVIERMRYYYNDFEKSMDRKRTNIIRKINDDINIMKNDNRFVSRRV
jgi:hypothetical protein